MPIKLVILNAFFFLSLLFGILTNYIIAPIGGIDPSVAYMLLATTPLFVLQFMGLGKFGRILKANNKKLYEKACTKPNGKKGATINAAAVFDQNIDYNGSKNEKIIHQWLYVKRLVTFSMLSFLASAIFFFV